MRKEFVPGGWSNTWLEHDHNIGIETYSGRTHTCHISPNTVLVLSSKTIETKRIPMTKLNGVFCIYEKWITITTNKWSKLFTFFYDKHPGDICQSFDVDIAEWWWWWLYDCWSMRKGGNLEKSKKNCVFENLHACWAEKWATMTVERLFQDEKNNIWVSMDDDSDSHLNNSRSLWYFFFAYAHIRIFLHIISVLTYIRIFPFLLLP